MAIGPLIDALERETAAEVGALDDAARADAERTAADAAARRARRRRDALADARARARRDHDAALALSSRTTRAAVLEARAAALDRVYAAARTRLAELLTGDAGARVLDRLLDAVLAVCGDGGRLTCSPPQLAAVRARLAGRAGSIVDGDAAATGGFTVEGDPAVTAGIVAERDEGRVTVDATLPTLLDRWWPRLRVEVRPPEEAA